ncbi:MAG TPA: FtsX-like permease family protein, partial [Pyrinomonadaceae bacterium]|nr:FtsX-like permease family protein [Pyrinomonadaceae bacterium]
DGAEIVNWREIKTNIEKSENVKGVSATTYESVVLAGTRMTNYAVLRTTQDSEFRIQNSGRIGVAIGKELAEKSNLKIGDEAEIVKLENEFAPPSSKVFVKEIFQTGLYEYDATWIRVSPADFVRLKGQKDFSPTVLSVTVNDIYKANETADNIRRELNGNFKIVDWQAANQPLFAALNLERKVALAIISLIIFIAALNITTTLALLVNERRLDIAVLRTCGAKTRQLIFIFLIEGLFLGFLGIFSGVMFGLIGCFLGNYFKIINLPAEVYSLGYIPFRPEIENIALIIFTAFLLCLTATVYPAFRASRVKPLENLRQQ